MDAKSSFLKVSLGLLCLALIEVSIRKIPADAEVSTPMVQQDTREVYRGTFPPGTQVFPGGSANSSRQIVDLLLQQISQLRKDGNRVGEARSLNLIGSIYASLGEKEQAIEYMNQALALGQAIENKTIEGTALASLGNVYSSLGEKEQAIEYLSRALSLFNSTDDKANEATILTSIGGVYSSLGDEEQALEYLNQAVTLFQAIVEDLREGGGYATALNSIGSVYISLGEYEQALEYLNDALLLREIVSDYVGEAATLSNIGFVYHSTGKAQKALEYYIQALSLNHRAGNRDGEANQLHNIGGVYDLIGDNEQALEYYNQALPLRRVVGDRAGEAATLGQIASVYTEQDRLPEALSTINEAIRLVEDLRTAVSPGELRTSYFTTVQDYYQLQLDIQMQLGQPEAAFETSEASRARLLLELLGESNVNIRQSADPTLLAQEQSLQQEIVQLEQRRISLSSGNHTPEQATALDRESDAVLQQLNRVIAQIRRSSPAYADIVQPQPLSLAQIQQQVLDADTALVQYALGEEQSYLWLVTKDHFQAYILPGEADIQTVARQFQSAITSKGTTADVKRIGDELVAQILPERPEWLAGKRLLVAGDGILSELPFAALPLPDQTAYEPLIAEHEVLSQPSITAISVLRQQSSDRLELSPSVAVPSVAVLADSRLSSG